MIISALVPILDNLPAIDEDHSAVTAIRFLEIRTTQRNLDQAPFSFAQKRYTPFAPDLIPVKNRDHIPVQFPKYRTIF